MKTWKAILLVGALTCNINLAKAASIGDLISSAKSDIQTQTQWVFLKSVTPSYFRSLKTGDDKLGFTSEISNYRFIGFDAGYTQAPSQTSQGAVVGGVVIHIDKLITTIAPQLSDYAKKYIPNTALNFWNSLWFGYCEEWDFTTDSHDELLQAGLELKF